MNIIIAGAKGAGKSSVSVELSKLLGIPAVEIDRQIEQKYLSQTGKTLTCCEIYNQFGQDSFRASEQQAAIELAGSADWTLLVCGGSTLMDAQTRTALLANGILIFLRADTDTLWNRIENLGLPAWLTGENGKQRHAEIVAEREAKLLPLSDIVVDAAQGTPVEIAQCIQEQLAAYLSLRCGAANTYGEMIRVTTFGESHGPAIGAVLDGVRPNIPITAEEIQTQLNRRRPGQSAVTTPRDEKDQVHILSGVFEGKTTGAPIAMVIYNRDQDSSKYEGIKDLFRPGHADFTFYRKYGIRDHRGGGRSSGRETAGRVMCGTIVRKMLAEKGVRIIAHTIEIAGIPAKSFDEKLIETNDVRCGDPAAAEKMVAAILAARNDNDSVGGIVQLEIHGLPAGLGDPVFGKLDARLTSAIMTIGAVKGIEIGDGFALTRLRGSQSNDAMADGKFASNRAGGIIGGISTGMPVILRIAVKPTSSIAKPQTTINLEGQTRPIETHGRHDPCIVPRIVPVIESMAALVLYDCWRIQNRIRPDWNGGIIE